MSLPRLKYKGRFFVIEDNVWQPASIEEVVKIFNVMAQRHEVVLDDIEELINADIPRASVGIRYGTASTA